MTESCRLRQLPRPSEGVAAGDLAAAGGSAAARDSAAAGSVVAAVGSVVAARDSASGGSVAGGSTQSCTGDGSHCKLALLSAHESDGRAAASWNHHLTRHLSAPNILSPGARGHGLGAGRGRRRCTRGLRGVVAATHRVKPAHGSAGPCQPLGWPTYKCERRGRPALWRLLCSWLVHSAGLRGDPSPCSTRAGRCRWWRP